MNLRSLYIRIQHMIYLIGIQLRIEKLEWRYMSNDPLMAWDSFQCA